MVHYFCYSNVPPTKATVIGTFIPVSDTMQKVAKT